MDRAQFLHLGLGFGAAARSGSTLDELLTQAQPTPIPSTVGAADVADVRAIADTFREWDARYGGGSVREAATAQLRHSLGLLNARCSENVRRELFSAMGYFGHVTAFMALDAHAHDDALRGFRFAQACAEQAQDWPLRAKVLNSRASQAISRRDPEDAVTFVDLALVRADRVSAAERAMLHAVRAHGLGMLGRVQEAARAIGVADEEFGQARAGEGPSWMVSYDAAHHHGEIGRALWQAAAHGHFAGEARERLQRALDGYRRGAARARTRSQIKLTSLLMATGDPEEASALGHHALDSAQLLRSPPRRR